MATPRTGQEDGNGGFLPFDNFVMIAIDSAQTSGLRLDNAQLSNPTWIDLTGTFCEEFHLLIAICLSVSHSLCMFVCPKDSLCQINQIA